MAATPEEIRLRYLYRNAVLRGKVRLPMEAARQLVGPDCAFHLYATAHGANLEAGPGNRPERNEGGALPERTDLSSWGLSGPSPLESRA